MRVKEFSIMRYGPLSNTGRILLHGFNLFWGKNEDGKTLTIDALVKLLLGRSVREFERINRVEENPEGPLAFWNKEAGKTRGDLKEGRTLRGKLSNVAGKEEEEKRKSCGREKNRAKATPYAPRRAKLLCNFITRSFSYLCLFFLIPPRMPISPTPHYFNYFS